MKTYCWDYIIPEHFTKTGIELDQLRIDWNQTLLTTLNHIVNENKLEKVLLDKTINLIVVEHKDRLARFGLN